MAARRHGDEPTPGEVQMLRLLCRLNGSVAAFMLALPLTCSESCVGIAGRNLAKRGLARSERFRCYVHWSPTPEGRAYLTKLDTSATTTIAKADQ